MTYIEGFVTPIPTAGRAPFTDHARQAADIVRDLGATRVVDTWGDDVPAGKVNDFAGAVQLEDGETVGFGWMEFPDKAARDRFGEQVASDPRIAALGDMPFDGARMIYGGFRMLVDLGRGGDAGYVDGFVLPVPDANQDAYRAMAERAAPIFVEHGATRYVEAWGDDLPAGQRTDFRRAAHARDGESVVFAWCEWPDKATRTAGMAAVMQDPRMKALMEPMPFDGTRMIYGGFAMLNDTAEKMA